jgi:hypothetical protein
MSPLDAPQATQLGATDARGLCDAAHTAAAMARWRTKVGDSGESVGATGGQSVIKFEGRERLGEWLPLLPGSGGRGQSAAATVASMSHASRMRRARTHGTRPC